MKDSMIFTEDDKFKPITTTKQSVYMLRLMRGGIKGCRQYEETEEDKMINIANCEALAVAIHSMEQLQKIKAIVSDCLSPCAITPTEGMIEIQKLLKEENIENLY